MRRRGAIVLLSALSMVVASVSAIATVGGYRLNLTPSEPVGLWRTEALNRSAEIGDLVFVCPPATAVFEEARRRGYLRRGLCPGGFAPLIKTVAALPGQRISIGDSVEVDETMIGSSRLRKNDGQGRPLHPYCGGIVPPDHLFLHTSFASSYDSRYFGPVPDSGLLGLARPILTFDP